MLTVRRETLLLALLGALWGCPDNEGVMWEGGGIVDRGQGTDTGPDADGKPGGDTGVIPDTKTAPETGPGLEAGSSPEGGPKPDLALPDIKPPPDLALPDTKPPPDLALPDIKPPPDLALPDIKSVLDLKPTPDMAQAQDSQTPVDAPQVPDLPSPPDAALVLPDTGPLCKTLSGTIGAPCTSHADCGKNYLCLGVSSTKGICTKSCTPDDFKTPLVSEDDCPNLQANRCGRIPLSGGSIANLCLRKCNPRIGCSECSPGIACHPQSGAEVGLYGLAVCLYTGCTQNSACPVTTGQKCDTSKKNCPAGQACYSTGTGPTNGMCTKPGVCDKASGLCDTHSLGNSSAKVGDPCKGDTDCGGNQECLYEIDQSTYKKKCGAPCNQDSQCCSGKCKFKQCTAGQCNTWFRNGYCTIVGCRLRLTLTNKACPAGSRCNIWYYGGHCQKSCDLTKAGSCRGHSKDKLGDYECRGWDNLIYTYQNQVIALGPVCDYGPGLACSYLKSSTVDCTDLGTVGNPTKMTCRDLYNTTLPNKYAPNGFCLDNTASGPTPPKPDGGAAAQDCSAPGDGSIPVQDGGPPTG